jgi:hypothetical protein
MDEDELTQDELDEERGDVLPDREAMSLVNPDPAVYPLPDGDLPPIVDDTGGDTDPAKEPGRLPPGVATVAGSEERFESASDEPQSEQISRSDSATAES